MPRAARRGEADRAIGLKLKLARQAAGVTQTRLGEALGVSFQQVQKYEKGLNRLSVATLDRVCGLLKVPHTYFLSSSLDDTALARLGYAQFSDRMLREASDLVQAFSRIADPEVRRSFLVLAATLGGLDRDGSQAP